VLTPGRLLVVAIAAYAGGFAALSTLRHRAFETGRFDLGNMVQAVWSTAHGDVLGITTLHGTQTVRFAAHVDPILVLFAPLWLVWPSPTMLLTVQAIAVALGAVPVFWLARKHLGDGRAALGFALAYLLYPATQWLTLSEFHPVALACPLLLYAFWYLDEERLAPFALFAVLAACTKEEVPLVVAGLGVWYALARRRVVGLVVAAAGAAWTATAVGVIIPHFNDGSEPAFYARYEEVGGSASGIAKTLATDPLTLLRVAFDGRGVSYLAQLLLPIALLPLAAPLALLPAAPELALNLLSSTPTQTSIHFHYTGALIPILFAAAVLGAKRVRGRPNATALVALALAANYVLGAIPVWAAFPGGEDLQAESYRVDAHDRVTRRALELVPDDAVVSASNSVGAHLSARRRFLSFPYLRDAEWVVADETSPGFADRIAPLAYANALARLRRNPRYRLVFQEDGVLVFRSESSAAAGTP
jgi:uncharacterized membrane protein